jgi:hypothetical protein
LALPGSNAAVERVFSLINALWTDEKNILKIETVKALTVVKDFSCAEFYVQISEEKNFLNRSINLINILMNLKNVSNFVIYNSFLKWTLC